MNIIELVKGYITPDLISKTSSELGENKAGISKAIDAYIPILLAGVLEKKDSTTGLFHTIKSFGASRGLTNLSTELETPDTLKELVNVIFDKNAEPVIYKVAEYAGISRASSSKLLDLTALTTFGSIGKEAEFNNITESDFFSSLNGIKDKILGLIPAGLGLGALGLGTIFNDTPTITETIDIEKDHVTETITETKKVVDVEPEEKPYVAPVNAYAETHNNKNGGGGFWKWIIPLILVVIAAFFLLKKCNNKQEKTVITEESEIVVDSLSKDSIHTSPKELSEIDLDGVALKGYTNGLEDQIIKFIKAPDFATMTEDQLKEKWFDFDNVNFVFGKTDQLEPGSEVQLENVVAILKKYPTAKIKLGAYTDKVGDDAKNKEISQKRADYLKAELTKLGVGSQVISAEGYGEEFAKVPETASDEERASDRKMSLRFTK
ncbi:OmpA family protein [Empedobacter brevis]|uniref:OmpA family protein n=1 Tax=Empedobacter brevis TaxID=247 RepID=UPI0039AEB852